MHGKFILAIQGVYIFVTGLWPLIDLESFIKVTGPKTDLWLVKTVGAVLLSISIAFFVAMFRKENSAATPALGVGVALALSLVDFYYVHKKTISKIYLLDGFMQLLFISAWVITFSKSTLLEY
jgi:hypothetical protein